MATLAQVKAAQPDWFSSKNKRFFGDVSYKLLHDKAGNPYLVRSTYAWSDMFGQPRKLHYRVNEVDKATLEIGKLWDEMFSSYEAAKEAIHESQLD